jgi:hypothetical protein
MAHHDVRQKKMKTERHGWSTGLQLLVGTLLFFPGALVVIFIPIFPIPYLAFLALVPLPFHIYIAARGHRFPLQILCSLIAAVPYLILTLNIITRDGTPAKLPL